MYRYYSMSILQVYMLLISCIYTIYISLLYIHTQYNLQYVDLSHNLLNHIDDAFTGLKGKRVYSTCIYSICILYIIWCMLYHMYCAACRICIFYTVYIRFHF